MSVKRRKKKATIYGLDKIKKASFVLSILENTIRSRILILIEHYDRLTLDDLFTQLKLERSKVSRHLKVLGKYGYLKSIIKDGITYYYIVRDRFEQVQDAILLNLVS